MSTLLVCTGCGATFSTSREFMAHTFQVEDLDFVLDALRGDIPADAPAKPRDPGSNKVVLIPVVQMTVGSIIVLAQGTTSKGMPNGRATKTGKVTKIEKSRKGERWIVSVDRKRRFVYIPGGYFESVRG